MKTNTRTNLHSRIDTLLAEIEPTLPDLDTALDYLQTQNYSIHYDSERDLEIWSAGQPVPIAVRRVLRKYKDEAKRRMAAGDASICPTKETHRPYREDGICTMCRQLEPFVNDSHTDVMTAGGTHEWNYDAGGAFVGSLQR